MCSLQSRKEHRYSVHHGKVSSVLKFITIVLDLRIFVGIFRLAELLTEWCSEELNEARWVLEVLFEKTGPYSRDNQEEFKVIHGSLLSFNYRVFTRSFFIFPKIFPAAFGYSVCIEEASKLMLFLGLTCSLLTLTRCCSKILPVYSKIATSYLQ